jgi:acetyl-CoA carboxylase carboxyltransferase component
VTDQPNLYDWQPLVEGLAERRGRALEMGGPKLIERQRSQNKLPVRERIDLLLDPGTFVEFAQLADSMDPVLTAERGYLAADGMVAGIGQIDGRRVAICAYDFTVLAGSMGAIGETKTGRMRELALRQRIPIVWLLDSAGARIQSSSGSTFAEAGALFREQVTMSGVVPQVAAMLGHCSAGTAYIPALADFASDAGIVVSTQGPPHFLRVGCGLFVRTIPIKHGILDRIRQTFQRGARETTEQGENRFRLRTAPTLRWRVTAPFQRAFSDEEFGQ